MDLQQHKPGKFQRLLYLMLFIVVLLGISFFVVVFEQTKYQQAVESRETSLKLAEELRQSSSDLARLVRSYVITGNPVYKQQFQAIVDIRDGKRARPENYSPAYWEYQANTIAMPDSQTGTTVALVELMRQAGVTREELDNLTQSKAASDQLVALEHQAMSLVEQKIPASAQTRLRALMMLADDGFVAAKADIMGHIIATEQMIIARTEQTVRRADQRLKLATFVLFLLGGILVWLIFSVGKAIRQIIGCPVPELERTLVNIGNGDFLTPIRLVEDNKNSVLAWLAKTQQKLAELNWAHFKAIIDSSDDAIISKNIHGIVSSWNRGAEKIFGYSANEMIGQPLTCIIPHERQHEEPEILARIAAGEKVDHFETQRLHKNGKLVDVSVSISPIYDSKGGVIGASKIARDISIAKAAEAEIQRLAFYDALTGLANRSLLQDRLQQLSNKASRGHFTFAVLFMDLDNFKTLNDTQGHAAGDALLQEVARRLQSVVRASDTVARFAGDEFVVLLASEHNADPTSVDWLETVMDKIIQVLAQPYQVAGISHRCTVSIGAAICRHPLFDGSELMKQADHAMYQAKYAGKNCYQIFRHEAATG
ncbi:MAG: diguanylate cyclase [Rheinheimera sp.]|nr:MAG: diguanylate cyclase [Rheinheimera sp.]